MDSGSERPMHNEIERLIATAAAVIYQVGAGDGDRQTNLVGAGSGGFVEVIRRNKSPRSAGESASLDVCPAGAMTVQSVDQLVTSLGIALLLRGIPRYLENEGRMVVRLVAVAGEDWVEAIGVSGPDDPLLESAALPLRRDGWLIAAVLHAASAAAACLLTPPAPGKLSGAEAA
jgi:hypothetical protein